MPSFCLLHAAYLFMYASYTCTPYLWLGLETEDKADRQAGRQDILPCRISLRQFFCFLLYHTMGMTVGTFITCCCSFSSLLASLLHSVFCLPTPTALPLPAWFLPPQPHHRPFLSLYLALLLPATSSPLHFLPFCADRRFRLAVPCLALLLHEHCRLPPHTCSFPSLPSCITMPWHAYPHLPFPHLHYLLPTFCIAVPLPPVLHVPCPSFALPVPLGLCTLLLLHIAAHHHTYHFSSFCLLFCHPSFFLLFPHRCCHTKHLFLYLP